MSEWRKCSQRLPPKGRTILVWYKGDYEFGMTFGGGIITIYNNGWDSINVDTKCEDLLWQHLPSEPN